MPDDAIGRIIRQLGEAISETLAESASINGYLREIREAGYDLLLVIEAKIGSSQRGGKKGPGDPDSASGESVQLQITPEDARFLKSLKISTD